MQAQNLRQVRLGGELVSAQQLWDRTAAYHKQSKLAAGALHLTKLELLKLAKLMATMKRLSFTGQVPQRTL
jgi:hypothetical protein